MSDSAARAIPLHTRHLIEKLLQGYCERICPPSARHAAVLGFRLEHDRVVVHELQRLFGIPGAGQPVEVAQFRYRAARNEWRLYHAGDDGRWHRYPRHRATPRFIELLREFDADPCGIFWGRINGKSLRWCSPRGRCADCDLRYCRVLGVLEVAPAANSLESTRSVRALTSAST